MADLRTQIAEVLTRNEVLGYRHRLALNEILALIETPKEEIEEIGMIAQLCRCDTPLEFQRHVQELEGRINEDREVINALIRRVNRL